MEYQQLGNSSLQVSRIGLGTWAIGGWLWGGTDDEAAIQAMLAALDQGINLIDTAPVYGFGHSESLVGEALKRFGQRHRVLVATKAGIEWHEGKVWRNASPARLRQEVEDSLQRLGTDYIDLYQVHWPDPCVPVEDTAATLQQLYQEGKIRAIGVSNYTPEQMTAFRQAAPLHTDQPPYNLLERSIEEDVMPYCQEQGIGLLTYGALCRGLLSGRMTKHTKFQGDDLRQHDPKFKAPRYEQYLTAVAKLDELARQDYGKTVLELAVRWVLDQGVDVALWGARRPEQLDIVNQACDWQLSAESRQQIEDILTTTIEDPVGPEFMAPPSRETT